MASACYDTDYLSTGTWLMLASTVTFCSPPPALLQRRYSVEGHVPNRCLDWSVIANVFILSVASRLGVFRRNVTVSGTDTGAFGAMTESSVTDSCLP